MLIFGMSFITFYRPTGEQGGEIEIDTGSFLVSEEGSGQPPGGGGSVSVPMPDIMEISAPAPAVVEMAALTTANPTMSFSLPAGAALSGVSPRIGVGRANVSNTVSGSPGEGVGSGGGNGGGIGGGNGSGAGVGQGTGDSDGGEGVGKRIKKIGRIPIDAEKLGVIIDTSTSMKPRSDSAKNQAMRYKNAIIKTMGSCDILKKQRNGPAVLDFVEEFGEQGVDAVYWLCDLQDYQSEEGVEILAEMLERYEMKLYISSWDQPPSPRLQTIVQNSGGAVELNGRLQD